MTERRRGESKEEKLARKHAVKNQKKVFSLFLFLGKNFCFLKTRREIKKVTKQAFKAEEMRQAPQKPNLVHLKL